MAKFSFKGVEVTEVAKGEAASSQSIKLNTPYKRLWWKLMELVSNDWEITYEEYWAEKPITKRYKRKGKYVDKVVGHKPQLYCKGTATRID